MKSVVLVPYCPLPANSGGKVEIWKHLDVLRELGPCTILSAATKPVGGGWNSKARSEIEARGFKVVLREEECPQRSWRQWGGIAYAGICKGLRMERAFGHSNPYHRYAFPADWFYRHTMDADIAVVNYSYWAHLSSAVPKALVLLDLWSNYMCEGQRQERRDLASCDLVFVISRQEEAELRDWGLKHLVWSPPAIPRSVFPISDQIALVGSANAFNIEGLRWLERAASPGVPIRVYGQLAAHVRSPDFIPVGAYADDEQPYRKCGIVAFATSQGMGVQIKSIEALAAGRAIVARRGAIRGIPPGVDAWVEVERPEEMWTELKNLTADAGAREALAQRARDYYDAYLDASVVKETARQAYRGLARYDRPDKL